MLAEAGRYAAAVGVHDRVHLHHASFDEAAAVLAGSPFDLVLCHNVMQYLPDVPGVLAKLAGALKSGGLLSLVGLNRYSVPYKTAFFEDDLDKALGQLDTPTVKVYLFDAIVTCYTAQEAADLLRQSGLVVEGDYGIRCVGDYWGSNEQKLDPEVFERSGQPGRNASRLECPGAAGRHTLPDPLGADQRPFRGPVQREQVVPGRHDRR